jgi:hypothetical protein
VANRKQFLEQAAKRRREIAKMARTMSNTEVANVMGITPQRVGQIVAIESARKRK